MQLSTSVGQPLKRKKKKKNERAQRVVMTSVFLFFSSVFCQQLSAAVTWAVRGHRLWVVGYGPHHEREGVVRAAGVHPRHVRPAQGCDGDDTSQGMYGGASGSHGADNLRNRDARSPRLILTIDRRADCIRVLRRTMKDKGGF